MKWTHTSRSTVRTILTHKYFNSCLTSNINKTFWGKMRTLSCHSSRLCFTIRHTRRVTEGCTLLFFLPPLSQCPFPHLHNSKSCYNPILVGEYLALLSQQYGIWVILLNMNGPFTRLNGVAWQWPFFPSLLRTQNNIQRSSLGSFPRNQQKGNSKLSLKPSKH